MLSDTYSNLSAAAGKFGENYGQRTKVYSNQSVLPPKRTPFRESFMVDVNHGKLLTIRLINAKSQWVCFPFLAFIIDF